MNIFKEDLTRTIIYLHQFYKFAKACNASFIAVVPKKKGATLNSKLIRIDGSVYKVIAKLLVERLKKIMGKLVSGQQNAFLKGR